MEYQVLARKWRPKCFPELIGQEHVVTVLVNSLLQQRLHHAYLFTGTRGVGKTTIARIFAKSLNCEQGITATPCGHCSTCIDIDQGRFIDLLEIDAASRTKVDDTREILDNVQYAPTRGRYKVYLIDEVHMLSRSSFNALLKTLEEPPEHVKFILATTDPQKLPITVLSRCLQFHLKALTVNQIKTKLTQILDAEKVTFDSGSLTLLAKAARGSMRDSLSLTDQAISQGNGHLEVENIQQMLGGIDQHWVFKIVIALIKSDSQALMGLSQNIASYAPNYSRLMAELIQLFHQIALNQVVKSQFDLLPDHLILLEKFSQALSPEDIQLYYQIVMTGRKDLPYASDEQAAFDMVLLRLLAFKPMKNNDVFVKDDTQTSPVDDTLPVDFFVEEMVASTSIVQPSETAVPLVENTDDTKIQLQAISPEIPQDIPQVNSAEAIVDVALPLSAKIKENNLLADESYSQYIESSEERADELSDLHQELFTIEQDAYQQGYAQPQTPIGQGTTNNLIEPNNQELPSAPVVEETLTQSSASTSLEKVLSARNMLRSRKKQREGEGKSVIKKPESANAQTGGANNVTQHELSPHAHEKDEQVAVEDKASTLPELSTIKVQPFTPDIIDPARIHSANQVDRWANMIDGMGLKGIIRQLAIHATIDPNSTDDVLKLQLNESTKHLNRDSAPQKLAEHLSHYLNKKINVEIDLVGETTADPYQIQNQIDDKRLDYVKNLIHKDEVVLQFKEQFQALVDEDSINVR